MELTPLKDQCLLPILMGTESKCNAIRRTDTQVLMISDNKILINNGQNHMIYSDCGPHNRTLTGNYLITFINCTLEIGGQKFNSKEIITDNRQEIEGAFANLKTNWKILEHKDILEVHNNTLWNREKMKFISIKQDKQHFWIMTILSGLSTTTITTIGIIIYICIRKKKVILKIRLPHQKINKQPSEVNKIKHDNPKKLSAEDDTFSPPREVTSKPTSQP